MTVLLIADARAGELKPASAKALTAALAISSDVDVLVACANAQAAAQSAALLEGVRKVLAVESEDVEKGLAQALSGIVLSQAKDYDTILFVANALGKAAMPRVAAALDCACVSDILEVKDAKTFVRGMYAGSVLATVRVEGDVTVAGVRATAFAPAGEKGAASPIETVAAVPTCPCTQFVSFEKTAGDRPELASAKVVLAGGRGLVDEAGFKLLETCADKLGAALGATRTAVDMGLAPNDWQVGQTGKMIAPELYVGFGISGAIQHTAGLKDAKIVVAVNNDPEAPFFECADYGLVADACEVLRALEREL